MKLIISKGTEQVEIDVPQKRPCEISELFAGACNNHRASGLEGIINLEDEDPKIFSLFLGWAFHGNIEHSDDYIVTSEGIDVETKSRSFFEQHNQLIESYILGKKLPAPGFRNAVIDLLIRGFEMDNRRFRTISCSRPCDIVKIYKNTLPGSPLSRGVGGYSSCKTIQARYQKQIWYYLSYF